MKAPVLEVFGGDCATYEDHLYDIDMDTLVRNPVAFRGLTVKCQYRPATTNKGFGFWHLIAEGPKEEERTPDLRRCERIRWVAWLIGNAEAAGIRWWKSRRGRAVRIVIWIESEQFAVVLEERSDYFLLKTAYWVKHFRSDDFRREHAEYWKNPW
ncbi:hypothetical protein [uncultured Thiodictyon sp.]|uniref:hypothetical protein n=1 Tax=uncultured Thiodictyon sp. TaxID=1846217 RepID=UPI0025F82308|nr:hypothetical protein [uncultured Thiodictyon sp.]